MFLYSVHAFILKCSQKWIEILRESAYNKDRKRPQYARAAAY